MPVSEKLTAQITQIQDNFALLSKWIEGLDSLLDVELIEAHLNTLKDILDVIGISGGLVFRKDSDGRRDSVGRRGSVNKQREDVIKSYARSLSTILHLCSNKIAKMETTLANSEPGSPEAKQVEKLVTSVKLYFDTGLPPVNLMINQITPSKRERRKSVTSPQEKHVRLNNMRRKGMLLIDKKSALFSNSFKPRWIILDDKKLHIFKDETTSTVYKELPLDAIVSISGAKLDGTVLNLAASDKAQMAAWMLAIDGTKHNFSFNSSMDPTEKGALLRFHSLEGRKGGHVKSNHPKEREAGMIEQDWSYFKEGELCVAEGEEKNGLSFKWNGETLYAYKKQANGEPAVSCLTSRWNGITLAYPEFNLSQHLSVAQREEGKPAKQPIFIPTPVLTFSWYEHDREPIEGSRVPIYKWTRHFLVEKQAPTGTGEWIVEGDIPEPLVMTLHLYHYHKPSAPSILPTEDVNKSLTRSKSASFSLPIPIPNNEAFAMFNRHVPPGKDKLGFNHFVTLMHEMKPGLSEPEIKLAFELVDVSKDGCVDLQEFSTWFTELKEWGND